MKPRPDQPGSRRWVFEIRFFLAFVVIATVGRAVWPTSPSEAPFADRVLDSVPYGVGFWAFMRLVHRLFDED